jgi:hypothetical protein
MKITFDCNTWRKVAIPENFPKDPIHEDYKIIRNAIDKKIITPFISSTIFTLEAIQKKDRKAFFKEYQAKFDFAFREANNGFIEIQFSIAPNESAHTRE